VRVPRWLLKGGTSTSWLLVDLSCQYVRWCRFGEVVGGGERAGVGGWSGTLLGPEGTGVCLFLRPVVGGRLRAGLAVNRRCAWRRVRVGAGVGLVSVRSLRTA
jgi:hypothetical protein